MSNTQERRSKYDYRTEYFKHNKGLFGCIYFCSQCGKPLLKKDVEVDHIVPLAKLGVNHRLNCVACCRKCNRSKSDKLDERAIKGVFVKVIEEILIGISNLVMLTISSLYKLLISALQRSMTNTQFTYKGLLISVIVIMGIIYIL